MERANLRLAAKGKATSGSNREGESTEAMRAGAEQPVVVMKAVQWGWSEGAALFSRGHWPTEAIWQQEEFMDEANPACEGQPGSGWSRRAVDCGVRG